MAWDEQQYQREYDLERFMIVAISDFNMGAMENKGLNIFNSKYILADEKTATDTDFEMIERIIAHEYFHNWTGNRITCRDWFQLCLKEGLTVFRDQQFSADMQNKEVVRIEDVILLKNRQFREDSEKIKELGDTIKNNKGVQKIKKSLKSGKIDINQMKDIVQSDDIQSLKSTALNTLLDVGQSYLNKAKKSVNK